MCHLSDGISRWRADVVFAGDVGALIDLSPWCKPLPLEPYDVNMVFLHSRSDLATFLQPLHSKILYCSHDHRHDDCWAVALQALFADTFDRCREVYQPEPMSEGGVDDDAHGHEDEDLKDEAGVDDMISERQRDIISSGLQSSRKKPAQLVPDGLSTYQHLKASLASVHLLQSVQFQSIMLITYNVLESTFRSGVGT